MWNNIDSENVMSQTDATQNSGTVCKFRHSQDRHHHKTNSVQFFVTKQLSFRSIVRRCRRFWNLGDRELRRSSDMVWCPVQWCICQLICILKFLVKVRFCFGQKMPQNQDTPFCWFFCNKILQNGPHSILTSDRTRKNMITAKWVWIKFDTREFYRNS